jgi:hypothetical protein
VPYWPTTTTSIGCITAQFRLVSMIGQARRRMRFGFSDWQVAFAPGILSRFSASRPSIDGYQRPHNGEGNGCVVS